MSTSLAQVHKNFDRKFYNLLSLRTIVVVEALIIFMLGIYVLALMNRSGLLTASENQEAESINLDVATCMKLPYPERPDCAKTTGIKIASLFSTKKEMMANCMKFRPFPVLIHFCLHGVRSVQTSPSLSPSPSPSP